MFFSIDEDKGTVVSGWIAPDNPVQSARVLVCAPGRPEIEILAANPRPDIKDMGIHTTGAVGFRIDAKTVKDLAKLKDLEIVEAESRLLLYRRFRKGEHIERRLSLFDSSVMPQIQIVKDVGRHFAMSYPSSERYPLETMLVLINNYFSKSIFISGRPSYQRYASALEGAGYVRAALLRDPFEELAERLLFIDWLSKSRQSILGPSLLSGVRPLVELAHELAQGAGKDDRRALTGRFRAAKPDERRAIASPMTRQFACEGPDDEPQYRHVAIALDRLAGFQTVGLRERYGLFATLLGHELGVTLDLKEPTPFPGARDFAAQLREVPVVVDMLEADVALHAYVRDALAAGMNGPAEPAPRDVQTV